MIHTFTEGFDNNVSKVQSSKNLKMKVIGPSRVSVFFQSYNRHDRSEHDATYICSKKYV